MATGCAGGVATSTGRFFESTAFARLVFGGAGIRRVEHDGARHDRRAAAGGGVLHDEEGDGYAAAKVAW